MSDLINREDAIEAIMKHHDGGLNQINYGLRLAKNEIQALPSAEAEWIPCSERLPEELEAVNVTWVNHNPPVYYQHIKDIPQTDTAVRYSGNWYWWDSTVIDVLAEYGERSGVEQIDKDIEVVAWMPLPEPYKAEREDKE